MNKIKFGKFFTLSLLLAGLLFFWNCPGPLSPRTRCYERNYCDTAVPDCMMGFAMIKSMMYCSSSGSSSGGMEGIFCNDVFGLLTCIDADETCRTECDDKNPL